MMPLYKLFGRSKCIETGSRLVVGQEREGWEESEKSLLMDNSLFFSFWGWVIKPYKIVIMVAQLWEDTENSSTLHFNGLIV